MGKKSKKDKKGSKDTPGESTISLEKVLSTEERIEQAKQQVESLRGEIKKNMEGKNDTTGFLILLFIFFNITLKR